MLCSTPFLRTGLTVLLLAFTAAFASAQCNTWAPLGSGMNANVKECVRMPNGDIVAGGYFTTAGGQPANYIARWNGTTWLPLGSGLDYWVEALLVMPNGDLIVGGRFTHAGGQNAPYIARWDGTNWSPLGTEFNAPIWDLVRLPNGDIAACGNIQYTQPGGAQITHLARWDGSTWSSLGGGMSASTYAMQVMPNGDLVVGGSTFISRWDGIAWSALGSGLNSAALCLALLPNGDLLAGGQFWIAGGTSANGIARWDGISWAAFGGGVPTPIVNKIAVHPNGNILVATGSPTHNYCSFWDGTEWLSLGGGTNGQTYTVLVLPNGDVIAGGQFTTAGSASGTVTANQIARFTYCPVPTEISQWSNSSPSPTTAVLRAGHSLCFDPIGGTVLMFGGRKLGASGPVTNELWSYDGIAWTLLTPGGSVPPTLDAGFVYDSHRGVFVTHGGTPPGPSSDHTWEYNPVTNSWAENLLLTTTPGGLASYGMAFDSADNKVVLYGGQTGAPVESDKTWEYDGSHWTQVTTVGSPGPIARAGMCFHAGQGVSVMFGGSDGATATNETWLFDSTGVGTGTWTEAAIVSALPPARSGCRMVYDSVRQICVMSGGESVSGTSLDDTWELDLGSLRWTQSINNFSGARSAHGLAFDANRGWVVQFGGWNAATSSMYGDTWEYGVRSETFGTGCVGSNGIPALDANDAPRFGQPYTLHVANLNPSVNVAVFALHLTETPPTPLAGIGMPGCTGYVPLDVLFVGHGTAGTASISLTMPTAVSLVDTTIFSQVLSFDPMINQAWLTVSNAHKGTLGH